MPASIGISTLGFRPGVDFYILGQDNETTREVDERRILQAANDIIENRPALSRWDPRFKDAFDGFMANK